MDNQKRLKKGDLLFKENDPVQVIHVVQSGRVALQVERGGKRLEIMTIGPGQALGEQGLFYSARQPFTAEALQETKYIEIPLDALKAQANGAPSSVKVVLKSMVDEVKSLRQSVRSLRMETDKSPCPQPAIPRVFALLNLVARHTGKVSPENAQEIAVEWGVLKLYTTRMFAESPQRMKGLLDILLKLKLCEFKMIKGEEGDEELSQVRLFNIKLIEDFAEFYQFNLYKGSYSEVINLDPLAFKVAKGLVALSEGVEVDRKGVVTLQWENVIEEMRKRFGIDIKNTHLDAMEKKGLFVKRQSREGAGTVIAFDLAEFRKTCEFWAFISEIDKWNEKGFVDLNEKEQAAGPAAGSGMACSQCKGMIEVSQKFCPHCGCKLMHAA